MKTTNVGFPSAGEQRADKSHAETTVPWPLLYKVSGAAALLTGLLLLMALLSLITAVLPTDAIHTWLSPLQNNWLIVLFQLNAGFGGVQFARLHGLQLLDIALLALVSTTYLGLYTALRRSNQFWSIVAAFQPFLGLMLFLATQEAGRSAIMGAGLVSSFVMLRSHSFGQKIAWIGILASVLLLVGDLITTANAHANLMAILIGIGYVLLLTWFFLVARKLFRLGRAFTSNLATQEEVNGTQRFSNKNGGSL